MVKSDPRQSLPTSAELPCSDDTPVDNEDQNFIPNLLLFLLQYIWADRNDWFFSVDMGVYHTTGVSPLVPIVPDGFLSLGVERRKAGKSRKSYVLWEENEIPPILALEIVSLTPGGEYDKKLDIYAKLGVLYYIIYNPEYWQRDRHQPFEVYRLVDGSYQLQIGEPFWMPEINLGIGRGQYVSGNIQRQVLYWYNRQGDRYQTAEEIEQQTRQQLELVQKQLEQYRQQFGDLS
ncbi:MAG: Uma2 family endonuclease [Nostoc sp. CreGUA01]|nr:Uma2 family endonuclease [Nostoc sp. CreGUA01]